VPRRRARAGRGRRSGRGPLVPTAIVTGAARGIGEAIARRLHAEGHDVALTDIDVEGAGRVAGELGAHAFEHDVRELESWERLVAQLDDVHVLVNNAARTEFRPFFEIDLEEWDDVLATNLRGVYLGCRSVGARLRDRGAGRIVNLASDAAFAAGGRSGAHYAASKAGVVAVTRRAATELAPYGVTVNAIAPAAIDGPLARAVLRERLNEKLADIPVGRLGRPEEIAALVAFLVSDDAGYITGATLDVNGGVLMR
jgi:3-oxoacyl-[acyl-carrier protein] reductase